MSKSSIWIAFKNGGIIPAVIVGGETDKRVGPHEPVKVPEAYGRHLIDDRFAYKTDEPAAPKVGKGAKRDAAKAARIDQLTVDIDAMKKAVETAADDEARTRLEAEISKAQDELKSLEAA